jgi:hypothetical protein
MTLQRFPIEAGHVLTFARSIGDTQAGYSDTAFADAGLAGVVVPPTFVLAGAQFDPEFPLRPQPGQPWWGSGGAPRGQKHSSLDGAAGNGAESSNVLHAEQRLDFARPVRVGDVLTATENPGRTWEKRSRSGALLKFSELITEYRDAAGELVVTATAVAVATEPPAGDGGESK